MVLTDSMQAIINKKILIIQVFLFLILQFNYIDSSLKPGDGIENLNYAQNISKYKKYTLDIEKNESNYREPLYPLLLSINIHIVDNLFSKADNDFKVKLYKITNVLFLLILGLISFNYWGRYML